MFKRVIIFLALNFAGLGLGSLFTSDGVASQWYTTLNQAPWTPPGWVFGVAWTSIMICFALYMTYAWEASKDKKSIILLFAIQWLLNMLWNPIFFYFHQVSLGLITIVSLTIIVGYLLFRYSPFLKLKSLLIMPYLVWLVIASSLNAYILLYN